MSVLKVKNGNQWDIVPAIKGDTGDPAADESITDAMLVTDGIKTEIDWLWGNQLMDIREGELLQTDDAYEAPLVSLDVDGKSTQVTTTGKNLLSDATDTWANYTIVQGLYKYVEIDVPPTTQLTVSPTSTVAISNISGFNGYVVFWIDTTAFLNANIIYPINASVPRTMTFTSGANGKLRIGLVNTMTQEALNALWAKVKLQLEAGSTATAYEPYTGGKPSPNPDYPQEIVSVDEPTLAFAGKNLLDTTVWVENKYIGPSGNIGGENGQHYTENYSAVLPGTYCLSMLRNTGGRIRLHGYDSSKNWVQQLHAASVDSGNYYYSTALTIPDGIAYVRLSSTAAITNQQLELGSTRTDYAPFTVGLITVPLYDGTLRSLPDGTKDELHLSYLRPSTREGWAWYSRELVQRIDSIDLGTLTWTTNYSGDQQKWIATFTNPTKAAWIAKNAFMCSGYKVIGSQAILADFTDDVIMHRALNARTVMVHDSRYISDTTPEQFRAAVDGVIWQYFLATPITAQLDPIELPIMPSKDTTIWSDPSAQLKMTYIQDTNLVIESLEATVADMATS